MRRVLFLYGAYSFVVCSKQKTAYEMRISDWSSDVCSSDLIRGIVGKTLGMEDAKAIGRTFGTMIRRAGGSKVATGYDGRVSSPMLEAGVIEGLNEAGVDAVSVGLGPTPMQIGRAHV